LLRLSTRSRIRGQEVCRLLRFGIAEPYVNPFDLEPDEELWEPEGARYIDGELIIERSFYNGEEIVQPRQRWTKAEQLELLDTHPLFTGNCP